MELCRVAGLTFENGDEVDPLTVNPIRVVKLDTC